MSLAAANEIFVLKKLLILIKCIDLLYPSAREVELPFPSARGMQCQ